MERLHITDDFLKKFLLETNKIVIGSDNVIAIYFKKTGKIYLSIINNTSLFIHGVSYNEIAMIF